MLKSFKSSFFRFLKLNRLFVSINIVGLSIALAVSFTIILYVINELSFDHCHKNRSRIYIVLNNYVSFNKTFPNTPYCLVTALKEEFPQIEKAIRVRRSYGFKIKIKDEFISINAMSTESEVFDIFTIPLILSPQKENLLDDKNSIVLSNELAKKLFPVENPIGKEVICLVNNEEYMFIVKGIFEDIPENSSFRAQCFINSIWPLEAINKSHKITNAAILWNRNDWNTWILLTKGSNPRFLENQFRELENKYIGENSEFRYLLQNLSDVYLKSDNVENISLKGNIKNIRLYSIIALLIVLVATINYIILSIAISTYRTMGIGIRKTLGANNNLIRRQLLGESILVSLLVLPIALLLTYLILPISRQLFQTDLHIIKSNVIEYVIFYLSFTIIIGIVSGIYTSISLSRIKVIHILNKDTFFSGRKKVHFRSLLIIIQLTVFCTFVSCSLIVNSQYKYALRKDMNYYTKDILLINIGRNFNGYNTFINNLSSYPDVIMVSGIMQGIPTEGSKSKTIPHFQKKGVSIPVEGIIVDYNFLKTMGITIILGRDFSREYRSDPIQSCILNETAVKQLGITNPIGKIIDNKTIIGVVKDFNLHSIYSDIPPIEIELDEQNVRQLVIHYKSGSLNKLLPLVQSEWEKVAPDLTFYYSTIEESVKSLYSSIKNLNTIVSIFALFTLLIASIGIFGLVLFVARTKIKEIGIRKAFGSSKTSIIYSFLYKNFVLVLIATLLSIPISVYVMTKWLENFAFKVNLNWWLFFITFLIATIVVLLTVFINSFKASRAKPVEALRYY